MKRGSRGFTLVEALVAALLVAVGVAGALGGIASMSKAQARIQEQDRMQRLALSKFAELRVAGLSNADTKGDFSDYGDPRYQWSADIETTSVQDLSSLTVTVRATDPQDPAQASVEGLVYEAPATAQTPAGPGA